MMVLALLLESGLVYTIILVSWAGIPTTRLRSKDANEDKTEIYAPDPGHDRHRPIAHQANAHTERRGVPVQYQPVFLWMLRADPRESTCGELLVKR